MMGTKKKSKKILPAPIIGCMELLFPKLFAPIFGLGFNGMATCPIIEN
jgi:hypothetical protein